MNARVLILAVALALGAAPALAQSTALAPKGAEFEATLDSTLSSKTSHNGDTFTMTEHDGFFHKGPAALKGAKISGHLENVAAAGPTHKASMNVVLDSIQTADGKSAPIDATVTSLKEFEPKSHHLRDTALVIGGAVAGHHVSKKTGVKGGTLAGAAAGFALASSLKSDVVVKKGSIVHLRVNSPVTAQN